jgi:adenine-specific DNA-methyltransferase
VITLDGRVGAYELKEIFPNSKKVFETPKPSQLVEQLMSFVAGKKALILDSFAGSGTTAQAVLQLNLADNGGRRFILVESEDYANSTTAERVRRVIRGVPKANEAPLRKGLGGSFTYCELGDPIDLERFFDGKASPSFEQVARYVVFTATGQSIQSVAPEPRKDWFIAESGGFRVHLIYRPDIGFMRTNEAALTMPLAQTIAKGAKGRPVLVFAAAKFMSQAELSRIEITFCQIPYSIYRVLGEAPDAS